MRTIQRSLRIAIVAAIVVTLAAMTTGVAAAAGPKGNATYNSVPDDLPGNVISQAFQATQTSEFGDSVTLGNGGRKAKSVDVVLSSWGCQSGQWTSGDCATTPGATFWHPITLNLYSVDAVTGEPDHLLLTKTQTFAIPFRPSTDARCTGGRWHSTADNACYNGLATIIAFKLSGNVTLPDDVIWTVAFNTSGFGAAPMGYTTECFLSVAGCGYDSLNVGAESFAGQPSRGTDSDPNGAVLDSATPAQYCDLGAGGSGYLRIDTAPGCWTDYRPLATIRTSGGGHGSDDSD